MCGDTYYPTQFNYIVYMASSGGLSVPESDQRMSYYGMGGIPDLFFDGYYHLVGAGSDAQDGHIYVPIIEDHWTNSTPVAVAVTDFSFAPGNAYATVRVELIDGSLTSTANTYVRAAIIENDVVYGGSTYEHVLRDMLPSATGTPLTIQNSGETQEFTLPFTMGAWNSANLEIIVWVQRDSDKFIYNSGNSLMVPFAAGVAIDGAQQAVSEGGPVAFGNTTVTNLGLEDDVYDISLELGSLPAGWDAHFTHDGADATSMTLPLASFNSLDLVVTIDAADDQSGQVTLNIASQGAGSNVASLDFVAVSGTKTVLLVADDGLDNIATDFVGPAVGASARTYSVWDRNLTALDGSVLSHFDAVVWACGGTNPGLEAADRAAIDTYLTAGGKILITGQDIAQDLQAEGGSANLWMQFKTRCRVVSGNSGNLAITGVADDPIGDGLAFTLNGGDGANNQSDPDVIETLTADAIPVFQYGTGALAGSRIEITGYKLVFLAFGLEGIADQADRNSVMDSSLDWLIGTTSTPVEDQAPKPLALAQNQPNPFNPSTKIAFVLDQRSPVRLEVFDLQGRLVRTLASEAMDAGDHTVVWDGRTDNGPSAASGTYVYRLQTDTQSLTRKMTLVK